jgi:hypothetical protein
MKEKNDALGRKDSLKAVKGIMFGIVMGSVLWTILIVYLLK